MKCRKRWLFVIALCVAAIGCTGCGEEKVTEENEAAQEIVLSETQPKQEPNQLEAERSEPGRFAKVLALPAESFLCENF